MKLHNREKKPPEKPAKLPISKNPMVAYKQGFEKGIETRRSNDTVCGFEFMQSLLRQAMYNTNDELGYLSMVRLAKFYDALQQTLSKMKDSYIEPDGTITIRDKVDLLWSHDSFVEDKFNEALDREKRRNENGNQDNA